MSTMLSDHGAQKEDNDHKMITSSTECVQTEVLLNSSWVKKEIPTETENYLQMNDNENPLCGMRVK